MERICAVNRVAAAEGLVPGMALSDARALLPDLTVRASEPRADARALARLSDWLGRYCPWSVSDGSDGVRLDISGSSHLFGGETALLEDLEGALAAFGLTARAAIADSLGAAWALARYGPMSLTVVPPGSAEEQIFPLPTAALRLPPETVTDLARLGVRTVAELAALPRASLTPRFGPGLSERLDQALARIDEPLSPNQPRRPCWVRRAFPEPIGHGDDIAAAARALSEDLCGRLEKAGRGARQLDMKLFLADGEVVAIPLGLSRPVRDPDHIMRLLAEHLPSFDNGRGADLMTLMAARTEPLAPLQGMLGGVADAGGSLAHAGLGPLVDRLGNRLGMTNIVRFSPRASHLPERALSVVAALAPPGAERWPEELNRPLYLLPAPEWVEVVAEVPDGPPVLFRWRGQSHKVARADGPERIAPEWWREGTTALSALARRTRDYYRIEDPDGRRFWLYRDGLYNAPSDGDGDKAPSLQDKPPRWYLHGLFP
jgi:protein ImuB